jgi:hypothetical protein
VSNGLIRKSHRVLAVLFDGRQYLLIAYYDKAATSPEDPYYGCRGPSIGHVEQAVTLWFLQP